MPGAKDTNGKIYQNHTLKHGFFSKEPNLVAKLITITIILALVFLYAFGITLISCGQQVTSSTGTEESPEIEAEESKETSIPSEESPAEIVDYENAKVGAEIKGFIPMYLCTNKDNYIKIEITNTSDFTWKSIGNNMVRIGYHFYGQDVAYSEYDNTTRTPLPKDVAPGESITVEVLINDIKEKGIYVIQIDPVLEGKFWFSAKGVPMLEGTAYFSSCSD
ncbi:MAG: hypothetical protein H5T85_00880 [Actinobacteria bacterium]|nr:hypothetical protein [Actinomycetota bacterium]